MKSRVLLRVFANWPPWACAAACFFGGFGWVAYRLAADFRSDVLPVPKWLTLQTMMVMFACGFGLGLLCMWRPAPEVRRDAGPAKEAWRNQLESY